MAKKRIECILVVEDDRAIRDIIVAILRKAGYEQIVTAGNAEEAMFYVFKDTGLYIRLAIVDLMLPNTSGLTLIRKIRGAKAPWRKAIPVVVLTSRTDTETYKLAAKRGIQAYLMKPISPALLTETAVKLYPLAGIKHDRPPEAQEPIALTAIGAPHRGGTTAEADPVAAPPTLDGPDDMAFSGSS